MVSGTIPTPTALSLPFKSLLRFRASNPCHNQYFTPGVCHPSLGQLTLLWLPVLKSLQAMQKWTQLQCCCSKQVAKRSPGTVSHIALETTHPQLLPPSATFSAALHAGNYCQQGEVHHFTAVIGTHHEHWRDILLLLWWPIVCHFMVKTVFMALCQNIAQALEYPYVLSWIPTSV